MSGVRSPPRAGAMLASVRSTSASQPRTAGTSTPGPGRRSTATGSPRLQTEPGAAHGFDGFGGTPDLDVGGRSAP